jgi:hypothetical protein
MSDIDFYEIVAVLRTEHAVALGVGNARGLVVGVSEEAAERNYAVLIGDRTFMLRSSDLVRTGERVDREAIYGGEALEVLPGRYSEGGFSSEGGNRGLD